MNKHRCSEGSQTQHNCSKPSTKPVFAFVATQAACYKQAGFIVLGPSTLVNAMTSRIKKKTDNFLRPNENAEKTKRIFREHNHLSSSVRTKIKFKEMPKKIKKKTKTNAESQCKKKNHIKITKQRTSQNLFV
jgi:hypothetical protein